MGILPRGPLLLENIYLLEEKKIEQAFFNIQAFDTVTVCR